MRRTGVQRKPTWRASWGRLAAAAVAVGALAAVAVAPSAATAATQPTTASMISSTNNAKLGTILVAGNTLYTLKPSKTPCTAACLKVWPPVLLAHGMTAAIAGTGVDASKLGTVAAAHNARQITYGGKKLFWFVKDKKAGQVRGNVKDKWGKWSTVTLTAVVVPNATATTTAPATTAPSTPAAGPAPTSPPATAAPETSPPATSPPETAPPATAPPQTAPPATQPPSPPTTKAPSSGGTAF